MAGLSEARVRVFSTLLLGSALALLPGVAQAQSGDPTAAAEDLFQRAKTMMASRSFATACPLFLESYRLDAAGGTLQNLAVCYEELGKWASAYARFHELRTVAQAANPPRADRIRLADDHIAKLEPRLSRIRIVSDDATAVVLDGVSYLKVSWSAGILIDPGAHELVASAPGKKATHITFNAPPEGTTRDVTLPHLVDAPKPLAAPAPGQSEREASNAGRRTLGFVIGGIGIAAIGTGAVFGALAITKNSEGTDRCRQAPGAGPDVKEFDASGHCLEGSRALTEANALKGDAGTFANVANVVVPVGLIALGIGAYLVFVKGGEPAKAGATTSTFHLSSARGRSFLLEGTF